jgi:protein involved in polysaccharide export with SLBB domain
MRTFVLILLGLVFAGGAALAQSNPPAVPAVLTTNALQSFASSYVLDDKHVLSPGDRVTFRILEDRMFGEGEQVTNLVVTDSRELDFPLIGRVSVTNKTCKQLVAEVTPQFEKDYYVHATVIVGIDMVNKVRGKVYVSGAVRVQGAIELLFDESLTAGQAILKSGGFGDFANKKSVKVVRTLKNGEKKTFDLNMIEIFDKGKMEQDIVLEPDDRIMVSERTVMM